MRTLSTDTKLISSYFIDPSDIESLTICQSDKLDYTHSLYAHHPTISIVTRLLNGLSDA